MIDVSCIIINYNTSKFTINAVASIFNKNDDSISFEVIVVDNASRIEDFKSLKVGLAQLNQSNLKLVRSKINTGFGAGNMYGIQHATLCKYYAFINNDTLQVSKNCLLSLKNFMDSNKDAAVCSPQMLDEDKKFRVTIDHFSSLQREIFRRPILETLFPKTYLNRKKEFSKPTRVHYVQGSFMFTNADLFNAIGGFDTNLFLYYEESDISRRLLKEKSKFTYIVPNLKYIHYKNVSTTKNIAIKIEQKISLLYYIEKHYGWFHKKILNLYYVIRYFFTSIIKPKYWKLFLILMQGAPLYKSLKQKQLINEEY